MVTVRVPILSPDENARRLSRFMRVLQTVLRDEKARAR